MTSNRKAGVAGCLALFATLGAAAAYAQQGPAPASPSDVFNIPADVKIFGPTELNNRKATAVVNGVLITGTDVEQRVALILATSENGGNISPEELQNLRLQVLRRLIDETLQIQEARAQEIELPATDIQASYERVATERFNMTTEQLDNYLRSVGSSSQSLRRQIEGDMAWSLILRRNIAPFVNVSSAEVQELHERLEASKGEPEYRMGEIFLSATPTTRETVLQNAQRIVEQVRQGGSFAQYARQFSEASTAAVGGDLGWIRLQQLQNPQLEEVAGQLNPGQLVGPVEIPGGFSILLMIDKRQVGMADPRQALLSLKQISLDFAPGTTEADARAKAATFQQAVQQIRGCGEADAVAAQIGAQVITNDELRVAELPETLQNVMLQMNVGQATPPFGSWQEGVRVLMLCGRDDPQVAGGPNVEQLMAQLQDDRVEKRAQRYLRDLRRDAVIDYN